MTGEKLSTEEIRRRKDYMRRQGMKWADMNNDTWGPGQNALWKKATTRQKTYPTTIVGALQHGWDAITGNTTYQTDYPEGQIRQGSTTPKATQARVGALSMIDPRVAAGIGATALTVVPLLWGKEGYNEAMGALQGTANRIKNNGNAIWNRMFNNGNNTASGDQTDASSGTATEADTGTSTEGTTATSGTTATGGGTAASQPEPNGGNDKKNRWKELRPFHGYSRTKWGWNIPRVVRDATYINYGIPAVADAVTWIETGRTPLKVPLTNELGIGEFWWSNDSTKKVQPDDINEQISATVSEDPNDIYIDNEWANDTIYVKAKW